MRYWPVILYLCVFLMCILIKLFKVGYYFAPPPLFYYNWYLISSCNLLTISSVVVMIEHFDECRLASGKWVVDIIITVKIWTKKWDSLFLYSANTFVIIIIVVVIVTIIRGIITVVPLVSPLQNAQSLLISCVSSISTSVSALFCSFHHMLQTRLADQACWDEESLVTVCTLFTVFTARC